MYGVTGKKQLGIHLRLISCVSSRPHYPTCWCCLYSRAGFTTDVPGAIWEQLPHFLHFVSGDLFFDLVIQCHVLSVKSSDGIIPSRIVHIQAVTVSRCVFRSGGFPLAFFFIQGLHVITCEMWLKPRGVALMEREAPEHTVSVGGL